MAVSFFVNRLYVLTAEDKVAYDERFHHGVNIIRGANSSGKSTITHLLFYGLGGDYTRFVEHARHCSRVMVEVSMDDATLTLSRPIEKDREGKVLSQRPMTIHWGTLDEALQGTCPSNTFGYKASDNKSSFSNVLFETMEMPIVQGDSNITMHQLLRLLYIDQESPTASLFYFEPFDNQTTRETVADLLLGIFDKELYAAKVRVKDLEHEISDARSELRALEHILSPQQRSTEFIRKYIASKEAEMSLLAQKVRDLRQGEMPEKQKKSLMETLKGEVRKLQVQCHQKEDEIELLKYDIEDTEMFIAEISRKQQALRHSISTRQLLGNLHLEYCPECMSPLTTDVPEGTCHLCKQEIGNNSGVTQTKRLIAELSFQKQESEAILSRDEKDLRDAKANLRGLKAQLRADCRLLDEMLGYVRSSVATAIEDLRYQQGEIKGELLQYYTMLEQATKYEELTAEKERLESEQEEERRIIAAKASHQEQRRTMVMSKIQEHGVYFLKHDERRQGDFRDASPSDFLVDFSNNMVFLRDRHNKFSASSSFFLKLVARFSLFFASLDINWMRYPHFIFADNMEDKGIEEGRAQKFQKTLIARLQQYDADSYQVIYTTSYITPELDHSEYVVGDHYDLDHMSLRNV